MPTLASTPPRVRKGAVREVMEVFRAKGQVGYLPSVATDAQLSFSAMTYQSAAILSGRATGIPLSSLDSKARARGPTPGGGMTWPSGPKWVIIRAARGPPARYAAGEFPKDKGRGPS